MIGKLKHTLKEKCPDCNKMLQVRVIEKESIEDGNSVTVPLELICCSDKNCDYQRGMKQKRIRRKNNL